MSLQGKVLNMILITFVIYGALNYAVQRLFILPSFATLEYEESVKDMGRAVQAIAREVQHLGSSVADWALWDDTYQYTQDRNDAYREANLNEAALVGLKINFMYIFDEQDQLVWGMAYDLDSEKKIAIDGLDGQLASLKLKDPVSAVGGVLLTSGEPVLISAKPILTSNSEGPAKGYLVMGLFLDTELISDQARISLQATPLIPGTADPDRTALVEKVGQQQEPYILKEEKINRVLSIMKDINNKPALLLEVDVPRSITARGQRAVSFALASLLGAGLIIIVMLIVVMQKIVLSPLKKLTEHIVEIGQSNELSARLSEARKDEIGILSKEFNRMIEQLSAARKKLMEQSYLSGRAEVASNVLHSVGNALNGVVISSYHLIEKAQNSCVDDVAKVAGLLNQSETDLARFLTEDPRGIMVPQYLESVGTALEGERQFVLNEAMALQEKVNQIKEIISRQQNFSQKSQVRESEKPEELLEEALQLSSDQWPDSMIAIEREYQVVPNIRTDRYKVLQILINLISNARSACMESNGQDKRIVLRLFSQGPERMAVQVVDNGVGIPPESLTKIFEYGFTTKKTKGQGWGLHASSLAASELGGKLTVQSAGLGEGATCTLELPCCPEEP